MIVAFFLALLAPLIFGSIGIEDEVLILPGLRIQPNFKHYSGYLNGSDTRKLHYWFVTSQNDPEKDPLVLWLNGGPGCSSLDGLISEHGPFRVQKGGYLENHPHSWNKIANIIYLESPACVGFSYSTDGRCDAGDDSTSLLNYNALKHFFVKFPQYKYRDFYITGESYGGFYVPSLAMKVLLSKEVPYIQFKGIAVGNGLSSWLNNTNGNLHFAYNHGLISDSLWTNMIATCCNNIDPIHCNLYGSSNQDCKSKRDQAEREYGDVNVYNIYDTCWSNSEPELWSRLNVSSNYEKFKIVLGWNTDSSDRLKTIREQYKILKANPQLFQYKGTSSLEIPCMDTSAATKYLNQPRVRYALHIPQNVPSWEVCSQDVNANFKRNYENMDEQYNVLFNTKNFRIWIYNGDVDMACSYLADEWYFQHFKRPVTQIRKPWYFTDENKMRQVGGFVKSWDKFVLLTVRGSGHMVPTDKPIPAYHIFESFIAGRDL